MTDRVLSPAAYARRVEHYERVGVRRIASRRRFVLGALVVLVVSGACVHVSHASTPHRATTAQQRAVDKFAGRHVPHLMVECRGRKCAAFAPSGLAVVLFERRGSYRVTAAVA